jgi:hypothetical protein
MSFLLSQKKVCAFKVEASAGSVESLTDSEVVFVRDVSITPTYSIIERPRNGKLGIHASAIGARSATAQVVIELAGKGSSGVPYWSNMLKACGMAFDTDTYSFSDTASDQKTITLSHYQDGLRHTIYGAMGDFELSIPSATETPTITFNLTGSYTAPADVAMLTPITTPITPPTARSSTFLLDAIAPKLSSFTFSAGNNVILVPDPSSASGYAHATITGRKSTAQVNPRTTLVASFNPWDKLLTQTSMSLSYTLGNAANNTIALSADDVELGIPTFADESGNVITNIPLAVLNDGFSIEFVQPA